MNLSVEKFNNDNEQEWDKFIENNSVNGTFLQSRNFLNYHKDRFKDHSLIIKKGTSIIALIPACEIVEDQKKVFYSHKGSTFGGVVINKNFNNINHIDDLFKVLDNYLIQNSFDGIVLKSTSEIFCSGNTSLLDYFYFKYNYENYTELSLYIDFDNYSPVIENNFSASKRRDLKYSLKYNLEFRTLETDDEVDDFYSLLLKSLEKHNTKPVHSLEELLDFKNTRFKDIVKFYGVYYKNNLIAGSMVFNFSNNVFHTQYLASDSLYSSYYPMNFLNYNLINQAYLNKFKFFSFGISTEDKGKFLNASLAQFKEGFGTVGAINRTYYKELK
ncbi:GNAT family N-acetyltransferase [Clostridium beijerinckii]|uniref:GNAT family N-acetyltransferase n=1 Tax=Clostridium beijerinckii TaxID=1520 RepID=UPI00232D17BE|nr:GNAT family N-acetyltransferase [Clostridium beijerinckii]